jgi:hypothetical protein
MTVGRVTFPPRSWDDTTAQFVSDHASSPTGDFITDFKAACNAFAGTSHADLSTAYKAFIVAGGETWVGMSEYAEFELNP